jgi:Mce-associated membrane protein
MPPREPSPEALDADNPGSGVLTETVADPASASVTETDEVTEVEARAEAARARATALRRQADAASNDSGDPTSKREEEAGATESAPLRRRRLRRPGRRARIVAAAVLVSCGALAGSGYLVWHHHKVVQQTQRSAEFAAAARNAVVTMMSIDASKARDDMQRFADETTGQFKAGVLMGAEDMVRSLEQSKIVAKATVQAVAVQSMTQDSAVVLVAAKSELTKPDQPKPEMRSWRLVVDVERDSGRLKISKIEFVP